MFPTFNKNHLVLMLINACIFYVSLLMLMNKPSTTILIICSLSMIGSLTYINMSNWMNHPSFTQTDFLLSFITSCIMTFFFVISFSILDPALIALRAVCNLCAGISAMLLGYHFYLKMVINRY